MKRDFHVSFDTLLKVAEHTDQKASWTWYERLQHWLVSRKCSYCKMQRHGVTEEKI